MKSSHPNARRSITLKHFLTAAMILAVALTSVATADTKRKGDADDTEGLLDLKAVTAGHGKSSSLLAYRFETYEDWDPEDLQTGYFRIYFDTDDSRVRVLIVDYQSEEEKLVGRIVNRKGDRGVIGHARVSRPNSKSVRAVFRKRLIKKGLQRYRWSAHSLWGGSTGPCSHRGCRDRAPNKGRITHRL